jgi:hypothetical protein
MSFILPYVPRGAQAGLLGGDLPHRAARLEKP